MAFLREHHPLSIAFGVISAILWLCSCFARSKKYPEKVDGGTCISGHLKNGEIQGRWNSVAAFFAALAALAQAFGV